MRWRWSTVSRGVPSASTSFFSADRLLAIWKTRPSTSRVVWDWAGGRGERASRWRGCVARTHAASAALRAERAPGPAAARTTARPPRASPVMPCPPVLPPRQPARPPAVAWGVFETSCASFHAPQGPQASEPYPCAPPTWNAMAGSSSTPSAGPARASNVCAASSLLADGVLLCKALWHRFFVTPTKPRRASKPCVGAAAPARAPLAGPPARAASRAVVHGAAACSPLSPTPAGSRRAAWPTPPPQPSGALRLPVAPCAAAVRVC